MPRVPKFNQSKRLKKYVACSLLHLWWKLKSWSSSSRRLACRSWYKPTPCMSLAQGFRCPKVPTWTNMWIGWGKIFNAHDMSPWMQSHRRSVVHSVVLYAWLTLIFSQSDFWNCTKRYSREMCDYTVSGLQKVLPEAFLQVTPYWRSKTFERADRYQTM
jgi:hypothetical protein